jgi:hypothetical protein
VRLQARAPLGLVEIEPAWLEQRFRPAARLLAPAQRASRREGILHLLGEGLETLVDRRIEHEPRLGEISEQRLEPRVEERQAVRAAGQVLGDFG